MFVYPADKKVSQPSILTINTKRLKRKSGGGGWWGTPSKQWSAVTNHKNIHNYYVIRI